MLDSGASDRVVPSGSNVPRATGARAVATTGTVTLRLRPGTMHVTLAGEIDVAMGPALNAALIDITHLILPVEIDARDVTFMDASGVAFIARIVVGRTARVSIVRPSPSVRMILRATAMETVVAIESESHIGSPAVPTPRHPQ